MSHVEMNIYIPSDLKHLWPCTRSHKETMKSFHITHLIISFLSSASCVCDIHHMFFGALRSTLSSHKINFTAI